MPVLKYRLFCAVSSANVKNIGFLLKNAPTAFKKAERCFNRAIAAAEKGGDKSTIGRAYFNFGLLYKSQKKVDMAKKCFSEAIKIFEELEAEVFLKQAKEALENLK